MRAVTAILTVIQLALAAATLYLVATLVSAATYRLREHPVRWDERQARHRFVLLVPAHNEENDIVYTVSGLKRLAYPADRFRVCVIADNCDDATADRAREAGAVVYERVDQLSRGKGHALAWGIERAFAEYPDTDAVVVVDADCQLSSNSLRVMDCRLASGAGAIQVDYVVTNPDASWSTALRYVAFSLINTIGSLGRSQLGLSAGLLGTGMCFSRDLLARHPWDAYTLTEDAEYHLRLVASGERVEFAPEASVGSAMPVSLEDARSQQMRWEGGRWGIIREWSPRLFREGIKERNPDKLVMAVEPVIPPQTVLFAANLLSGALALLLRSRRGVSLALLTGIGQAIYVFGGMLTVGAPASVYRALAYAPVLTVFKIGIWLRILAGRGATDWVRTTRSRDESG